MSDESGNVTSRTFAVTVEADVANGGPFLEDIPPVETTSGTPVTFTLAARDVEGDPGIFTGRPLGDVEFGLNIHPITGEVTVTPPAGFVGTLQIEVRVEPAGSSDTLDRFDRQLVTIEVLPVASGNALTSAVQEEEDRLDLTFTGAIDDAEFARLVDQVLSEDELLRLA